MAEIVCTNQEASAAYKGQQIIVTLTGSDAIAQLHLLAVGNVCTIDSSTATGTVGSIDLFGHSFKVKPDRPELRLGTGTSPQTAKCSFDINDSVTVVTS